MPAESAVIGSIKAFCCVEHLVEYAKSTKAQDFVKKTKKKETRLIAKNQLTRRDYEKIAQTAFNAYVRARDFHRPCISCGCSLSDRGVGGSADCGHYRSVGSSKHLRYHLWNAHGQCKRCNRYLSGNAVEYRKGIIARLGKQKVESLEADNRPRKYTIDDLKRIARIARKRLKRYQKKESP